MERFNRRPLAAAIVMAFSAPGLAFAQAKPAAGEQTLPEVRVRGAQEGFRTESTTTGTRTDTPLRDIPQTINIVPQELIRQQGATNLGDALRNVPGISYAAPEGGTQANNVYYIRGFQSGGDLFLDGIRDIGEYNRDLFNVDQVDVLKGPSSLMFGRGSVAGVINQVSKTPGLLGLKAVDVTLGSEDKKRVTADVNVRTGDSSALRINALVEDSGYYRYPQGVEKTGVAPSFRFGIGQQTDVTLSYYYLKTRDVTDYGQPTLFIAANKGSGAGFMGLAPISADKYYGFQNYDQTDHETQMATARIDHLVNRDLSVRETLRWSNFQRKMEATIATLAIKDANNKNVVATTPLELMLVDRTHTKARDNDDTTLISQTELTWKVATGSVKHTVLGGLELGKETLDRNTFAFAGTTTAQTPLLNPDPTTALNYTKTPLDRFLTEAETIGIYVQDQLEFSPQWKALLGVRWERYDTTASQKNINTGATVVGMDGVAVDYARTDEMVSYRAGLMWQPTRAQSYYVSYGNSYNPTGELGVYGQTGTSFSTQASTLEPEENVGYEIGGQWDFANGMTLRSALFRNEKTNQRINDPVTGVLVLAGERRVDGLEAQLTGRITPNWDVIGSIAFMNGKIIKSNDPATEGKTPLGVPDEAGSLWTVYRLGASGWEIGGGAFWSQEKFLDDANLGKIPAYTRWDATVAYVQKKYEIRLNVFNLTDELYYYGGYQNSPSRVLPGAPLEYQVTLRYNFD